jgi:hypothetical protein
VVIFDGRAFDVAELDVHHALSVWDEAVLAIQPASKLLNVLNTLLVGHLTLSGPLSSGTPALPPRLEPDVVEGD